MKRVVLAFLIMSSLLVLVPSAASQDVIVDVEGPRIMPIGGKAQFNITAAGGPGEQGGNYNITAFLLADNLTGADPSPGKVFRNLTTEPHWEINITVPYAAQTVTFVINVTSSLENETDFKLVKTKIRVVGPIVLSAEIFNPLEYELKGVPVDFYVRKPSETEDRLVGSSTIESIAPGKSEYASFDWIIADPEEGQYTLTVVVDLDRDGTIDENAGDSVAISYFYVGGGVNYITWILVALIVALALLAAMWLISKPKRRP
ncbi:MAG: hypothetical protein LN415_01585 [Candidatus Thermoplasmatota archaeon]|nr:hypothetical protein [Candidatus Thermoplasmatota archaeon]